MKPANRILSILLALVLIAGLLPALRLPADAASIAINSTNFPDDHFRSYVSGKYDANSDGSLSDTERNTTAMDCSGRSIASLKGIEYFTSLKRLDCSNNQLTTLDTSKNTALTQLLCFKNQLSSLNVSKNTKLEILSCQNNKLSAVDLTANTALTRLDCSNNKLTALNVGKNTALTELMAQNNVLSSVDVSKNTALTRFYCTNNLLTALDVGKNTKLEYLYCAGNNLSALDLSKNAALVQLLCYQNDLTTLDLTRNTSLKLLTCYNNDLTELKLGKNSKLEDLYCYRNDLKALDVSGTPIIRNTVENGSKDTSNGVYDKYELGESTVCVDKDQKIRTNVVYPLKVRGCEVTDDNRKDILGDGVFSFDGVSTLTVKGDCDAAVCIIENIGVKGLRIKVLEDSTLTTSDPNVILARTDTTITGPGMLTLKNTYNDGGSGIYALNSDVTLTLELVMVTVDAWYGITGPYGSSQTRLILDHSCVSVSNANGGAIFDFGGGITLRDCKILFPRNGSVGGNNGRVIVDKDGKTAISATILWTKRTNPFTDVSDSDPYYDAVLWAYHHYPEQITNGTSDTLFSPNKTVTRGQAMRFLWNAVGQPTTANTKNPFTDNIKGRFYYDAVLWAYYNDPRITDGTTATTFSPNKTCNRAQIITFLWKAVGRPAPTIANPYSDVKTGKYYTEAAIWAYEQGIEKGENGKFNYNTECTRAAVVLYLYRFYTGKDLVN